MIVVIKQATSHTISRITTILTCFHSFAKKPNRELTVSAANRDAMVKVRA
ncbi:MAG: hypothetical protein ACFE9Q_05305 [Candidatus Hodarchaeota archaeon]